MYQLIIRGARIGDEVADVGIEGGRIARIAARLDEGAERELHVSSFFRQQGVEPKLGRFWVREP